MGRASKNKGYRMEKKMEAMLLESGVKCKRQPLSGILYKEFPGDIRIPAGDKNYIVEVKSRKGGAGFVTLEKWKGEKDILMLHRNYTEPMVVMDFDLFAMMVKKIQGDSNDG